MDSATRKKQGLGRLLEIAGEKKGKMIISCFFAVLSAAMALVPFIVIYLITVELLDPPIEQAYVWRLAWIALGAVVCRFVFRYISGIISHIVAFDILYGLRKQLARHLGGLPMGYFTQRTSGGIQKILNDDVERVELFVAHHLPDLVAAMVLPVMTLIYLFIIDWRLSLATMIPLPLAFIAQKATFSDCNELVPKYHEAMENMNGTIIDYVRGMPVVKIFNQTVHSFTRLNDSVYHYRNFVKMWSKKSVPYWAAFSVIVNASLFFILPVGVWLYTKGTLDLSVLLLFLILGAGYTAPLIRVVHYGALLRQCSHGVKRIDAIFLEPVISAPAEPKVPEIYSVEFCNVSFSYGEKRVLHDVSFVAKENTVTVLVGPSGAGKTTVGQLILRFWDIQDGDILIGGTKIKAIPIDTLMNRIAFVFQDVFMLNDTVYENIRMGMKEVDQEQVIAAAKAAQAHEFIETLPNGYQTMIGERGTYLSGGESQRLSIARAILKNAPIVVLDEATTFADPENESKIQDALSELMHGKTVIVIAHRLSTITDADEIVVINEGHVVGKGKHEELLKSQNQYKKMWEAHMASLHWTF